LNLEDYREDKSGICALHSMFTDQCDDRTFVGSHGTQRVIHRVVFSDCQNGLGIKIIGSCQDRSKEEYGIFIKEILPERIAATDQLCIGDLILEVNGQKLCGVTNERAVDILQMASATSCVSLLIARDEDANDSIFQIISVSKETGLGLQIVGGIDKNEGPLVYILAVIPGGDCHKDGRLRPGDQLVSVDGESLIGINYEEARNLINRTQPRSNTSWEITFIRHDSSPDEVENMHAFSSLLSSERCGLQNDLPSPTSSSNENVAAEKSVLNMAKILYVASAIAEETMTIKCLMSWMKTGFKKGEQFSAFFTDNSSIDVSAGAVSPSWRIDYGPQRKISLNPSVRLKADKLEMEFDPSIKGVISFASFGNALLFVVLQAIKDVDLFILANPTHRTAGNKLQVPSSDLACFLQALKYLGIQPTEEEQEILRKQLPRDSEGTVCFGDFVQVARNLFSQQLDETGHSPIHEIAKLLDSQLVSCDHLERYEMEQLRKEKNEALKEICQLKVTLDLIASVKPPKKTTDSDWQSGDLDTPNNVAMVEELAKSECVRKQLAEELRITKQEAKASVEEARTLRSRIHLAEAAQKQARGMELDYEEVISLLEIEITRLRAQLADHGGGQNKESVQDLRKRITVLDCQLRKSETAKKTFEVATEKLLEFVELHIDIEAWDNVFGH
ncbi:hypothetical protein Chor_012368, partial [Crotalus horridus]